MIPVRIRGAGAAGKITFAGSRQYSSPSNSRKITGKFLVQSFQSGAVTLPLCGNEGRFLSAVARSLLRPATSRPLTTGNRRESETCRLAIRSREHLPRQRREEKGAYWNDVNKKLRFEVFKRDGFKCGYCGRTPPAVVLEADHIDPVSKGGPDIIENLITACFDCNRGKRDIPLSSIPNPLSETMEQVREREAQIKGYRALLKRVETRIQRDMVLINVMFNKYFEGRELTELFLNKSVRGFLKQLPLSEVLEAMRLAGERINDPNEAVRYFCGICWKKIRPAP